MAEPEMPTVGELVLLALGEGGVVNFNILKLLLRDVVEKTGIDKKPADLSDLELAQLDNYRNYVQGAGGVTPMNGVLKVGQGYGTGGPPYMAKQDGTTQSSPDLDKSGKRPKGEKGERTPRTPKTGDGRDGRPPPREDPSPSPVPRRHSGENYPELAEKVHRLEKHLEALYELPTNKDIIERAKSGGGPGGPMSVNDMWQIIQLNNRIAAAEAAIQKMASLIEDLAKNMGNVKSDTKKMKKEAETLVQRRSDLEVQGQDLSDKFDKYGDAVDGLKKDIENLKRGWKKDRDNIEKVLGVQLGAVPSFMKPKHQPKDASPGPGRGEKGTDRGTSPGQSGERDKAKEKARRSDKSPGGPLAEEPSEQFERGTQTFVKAKDDRGRSPGKGKPRPTKPIEERIPPEEISQMTPSAIMGNLTPEEVREIPTAIFNQMAPEQKKAIQAVKKSAAMQTPPLDKKPPMGVKNMAAQEIRALSPEELEEGMPYEEAVNLTPNVLNKMSPQQRKTIQGIIDRGPPPSPPKKTPSRKDLKKQAPKKSMGVAAMKKDEIQDIPPEEIVKRMSFEEAKDITPSVLEVMSPEQRDAVKKVVEAGPESPRKSIRKSKKSMGVAEMNTDQIVDITPEEIAQEMPYEEAKNIPPEVLRRMTAAQQEAIKLVVENGPEPEEEYDEEEEEEYEGEEPGAKRKSSRKSDRASKSSKRSSGRRSSGGKSLTSEEIENLANVPPEELAEAITPSQAVMIPDEMLEKLFSPNQIEEIKMLREEAAMPEEGRQSEAAEQQTDDADDYLNEAEGKRKGSKKDRPAKPLPQRHKDKKHHKHHDPTRRTEVDVVKGPIPAVGEPLAPMTLEEYLASMPPEDAANMAADAVQRELTKQFQHLQGMQRQLATDIQQKMEFIYQKLLKEIATQQMTTSPYMSVGGPDECLGPGVCTGHGMPAGIAVCQFPEAKDRPGEIPAKSVCPGPGVCPGSDVCPYCSAGKQQDASKAATAPQQSTGDGPPSAGAYTGPALERMDVNLLQEMKSLVLLDLEKIREEMRTKQVGTYNEQDILERLSAVWEALKILKHNEEALAVKLAKQDATLKKFPTATLEKLNQVPDEHLEALATGSFRTGLAVPGDKKKSMAKETEEVYRSPVARTTLAEATGSDKEDIQTLFNNLANVIAECTEQREKIEQMGDTARILETGMVTKQMLIDALSDKADKGLINTKVSYDEFGNTIDELHTQLHNLMVEGYQRNENWKKVTSDLAEELAEKLDKVELAPIRAFFKNHLKTLEEKVKNLSALIEEPDSAGTRKKLLRDYNCLSCDRVVNISGVTNGPLLPTIGPIPAGHPTASKRALDLHRMRMLKKFDNSKNLNAMERQGRGMSGRVSQRASQAPMEASDVDVMQVVNRYTGGSHTAITNASLIAAQRKSGGSEAPMGGPQTSARSVADIAEVMESPPPPEPIAASPSMEWMEE